MKEHGCHGLYMDHLYSGLEKIQYICQQWNQM